MADQFIQQESAQINPRAVAAARERLNVALASLERKDRLGAVLGRVQVMTALGLLGDTDYLSAMAQRSAQ